VHCWCLRRHEDWRHQQLNYLTELVGVCAGLSAGDTNNWTTPHLIGEGTPNMKLIVPRQPLVGEEHQQGAGGRRFKVNVQRFRAIVHCWCLRGPERWRHQQLDSRPLLVVDWVCPIAVGRLWSRFNDSATYHTISSTPLLFKYSLVLLKCLFPKNPLSAENGEGCADISTRCLLRSMISPFF